MIDWFFTTLKTYPEIAIFLALALGYYFGKFTYKGIGLGSVTATLIAAVVIGQIGITVNQPLKAFSFLMFLFAVGYAVGPQLVGGQQQPGGPGTAWTRWALRAYKVQPGGKAVGLRVAEAESLVPDARLFILRIRRGGEIMDATADIVLKEGDVVAVAGEREVLVNILGAAAVEVEDRELLAVPVEGVDILVTNKEADGKTLEELATRPAARGVFLRKITRGATATDIPILPGTEVNRGDLLTLVGRTEDIAAATKMLGVADRPTDVTDMARVGAAIVIGALIGALGFQVGGLPLTLP